MKKALLALLLLLAVAAGVLYAFPSTLLATAQYVESARARLSTQSLPVDDLDLSDPDAEPEIAVARMQRMERIEDALAALPQRQREALLLCHYEGQTQDAAAAVLGVSVEAVESLLARARRSLRAMLPADPAPHSRSSAETNS